MLLFYYRTSGKPTDQPTDSGTFVCVRSPTHQIIQHICTFVGSRSTRAPLNWMRTRASCGMCENDYNVCENAHRMRFVRSSIQLAPHVNGIISGQAPSSLSLSSAVNAATTTICKWIWMEAANAVAVPFRGRLKCFEYIYSHVRTHSKFPHNRNAFAIQDIGEQRSQPASRYTQKRHGGRLWRCCESYTLGLCVDVHLCITMCRRFCSG